MSIGRFIGAPPLAVVFRRRPNCCAAVKVGAVAEIPLKLRDSRWPMLAAAAITIVVGRRGSQPATGPMRRRIRLARAAAAAHRKPRHPRKAIELIVAAVLAVLGCAQRAHPRGHMGSEPWPRSWASDLFVSVIVGLIAFATVHVPGFLFSGHRVFYWAHGISTALIALVATRDSTCHRLHRLLASTPQSTRVLSGRGFESRSSARIATWPPCDLRLINPSGRATSAMPTTWSGCSGNTASTRWTSWRAWRQPTPAGRHARRLASRRVRPSVGRWPVPAGHGIAQPAKCNFAHTTGRPGRLERACVSVGGAAVVRRSVCRKLQFRRRVPRWFDVGRRRYPLTPCLSSRKRAAETVSAGIATRHDCGRLLVDQAADVVAVLLVHPLTPAAVLIVGSPGRVGAGGSFFSVTRSRLGGERSGGQTAPVSRDQASRTVHHDWAKSGRLGAMNVPPIPCLQKCSGCWGWSQPTAPQVRTRFRIPGAAATPRLREIRRPRLWEEVLFIGASYFLYSLIRNGVPTPRTPRPPPCRADPGR